MSKSRFALRHKNEGHRKSVGCQTEAAGPALPMLAIPASFSILQGNNVAALRGPFSPSGHHLTFIWKLMGSRLPITSPSCPYCVKSYPRQIIRMPQQHRQYSMREQGEKVGTNIQRWHQTCRNHEDHGLNPGTRSSYRNERGKKEEKRKKTHGKSGAAEKLCR